MNQLAEEGVLMITRVFDAPRERVFEAWTDAGHLAHWLGPADFTVPFAEMDSRIGGTYRACIRSPDGVNYWMHGTFREIERPARLVFTWTWEEGHDDAGRETLITLTFEGVGGKTLMTFRQEIFESAEARESHEGGWSECFDRLESYLAGEPS